MRNLLVLLALILLCAGSAEARAVRLMYEAPSAAEGGPAVVVTFEEQREEKKGGKDPTVIANERGSYSIPTAVRSGKGGTGHAADVVPDWAVDVLKSAGYAATRGEPDAQTARLHLILRKLWGDQIPIPGGARSNFSLMVELQLFAPGAAEPGWTSAVQASGGTTTVMMRFDDPAENGFVRTFDEATKNFVKLMASAEFQAILPGDVTAAQASAETLGAKPALDAKSTEETPEGDGVETTAADLPKGFESWDPGTYQWTGKTFPEGFVWAGVGAGLFIAGDQWSRAVAIEHGGLATPLPIGHAFSSVAHIPKSTPDPGAEWAVQAYVSDIMFSYGVHIFVPSLGMTVPTLIAAATGADVQTSKAVMGLASIPSFVPGGVAMVHRFHTLFRPVWDANQVNADSWHHFAPGLITLVIGVVDIAIGGVQGVFGVLYATEAITARADEKGLLPAATDGRRGLQNSASIIPMVTPTEEGLSFGVAGTF